MIDLTVNKKKLDSTIAKCRENNIILPTLEEQWDPSKVSDKIKNELKDIGLWDVHSRNLFRVTWQNEPKTKGGQYAGVNYVEIPSELTGVKARIFALVGKWFPTGAHKVGASYACLVPRLVTGQFDPSKQRAVWPSTGNYCRGGAYVSALLGCESVAILPEEMSKERFEWLKGIAHEVIATPGCESNVKEIFDKCWELREKRGDDIVIFNQFEELGNHMWHYNVTGRAIEEIVKKNMTPNGSYAGSVFSSGSAGTTAAGSYMKDQYPKAKVGVSEALQCPTLLNNGFGGHRIEGIGDKHVPWIHDVKDTDMVVAIDDEASVRALRLFNEDIGRKYLAKMKVSKEIIDSLDYLGISGICNLFTAIKFAKYYELGSEDIVCTVFTDSLELYGSRLQEMEKERGKYTEIDAARDYEMIMNLGIDNLLELTYQEKKRVHNLKYYTWIEQQGRELDELNSQWYDHESYWGETRKLAPKIDELINDFNDKVGLK